MRSFFTGFFSQVSFHRSLFTGLFSRNFINLKLIYGEERINHSRLVHRLHATFHADYMFFTKFEFLVTYDIWLSRKLLHKCGSTRVFVLQYALQHTGTNAQYSNNATATHCCNTLNITATTLLQHTKHHCNNTLQDSWCCEEVLRKRGCAHMVRMQHTATTLQHHCNTLNITATTQWNKHSIPEKCALQAQQSGRGRVARHMSTHYDIPKSNVTHCNNTAAPLQHNCKTRQHTWYSGEVLCKCGSARILVAQHTATYCNTLQHYCNTTATPMQHTATHCNTLQQHCSTLQHTATHC